MGQSRSLLRSSSDEEAEMKDVLSEEGGEGDLEKGDQNDYRKGEDFTGLWELRFLQFLCGWHSQYSQLPTGESRRLSEKGPALQM